MSKDYSMIKANFLRAPETQIGEYTRATISDWGENPTALQILRTLDSAVHISDSSTFVIRVLEIYLNEAIETEKTTYDEVVNQATWRTAQ